MIIKRGKGARPVFVLIFVIFMIYALVLLYPLFFAFNASLKENGRAYINDSISVPWPMYFSNYIRAFKELEVAHNNFFAMIFNSVWWAAGCTVLEILCSSATAYCVCKYRFRLRNFFYALSIFIMIIPIYGSLPSAYRMYATLGLLDSRLLIIIAANGFGFSFIILYSYFQGISWDYAEAAFVDGGSHYMVFFKIMMPMAMPAVTAIGVISFVGMWNDYSGPLLFLPNLPTLASGLWMYENKIKYMANQPIYFAGVILSLVPVITIFIVFQNTIMENINTGGLKG